MSTEATLLIEVGSDFTTEFLRNNIGRQFRLKDLKGCPVIKIIRLDGSSGDNSDEKLVRSLTGNRIDGEIETVEVFVMIVFQGRDNPFSQRSNLLFTQVCH